MASALKTSNTARVPRAGGLRWAWLRCVDSSTTPFAKPQGRATRPNMRIVFPAWVVLCLVPAYWYGHRIGIVSYSLWEILGTIAVVLAAVVVAELWEIIRPLSAVTLAILVCLFFLARRRWLSNSRSKT